MRTYVFDSMDATQAFIKRLGNLLPSQPSLHWDISYGSEGDGNAWRVTVHAEEGSIADNSLQLTHGSYDADRIAQEEEDANFVRDEEEI